MNQKNYLLFDLDGTLSDPIQGIAGGFNHALNAFGYGVRTTAEIGRHIGPPLDASFRDLTGSDDTDHIQGLVETYREYFGRQGYAENQLYPDIPGPLASLKEKGIPMGLCTSKRKDFAKKIIDMFRLESYFDFISGGDVGIPKGDQIKALMGQKRITRGSIMIGDRNADIDAAKANGIRSAGVLWGYGSREELERAGADWILERPDQLPDLADAL